MTNLEQNFKRIAAEEGWPDMIVEWSKAGSISWIKGPKCPFNKIDIQDNLKTDHQYAHAMFLHELAHFKYHRETNGERHGHDGRFADIFTELVAKHMIVYA